MAKETPKVGIPAELRPVVTAAAKNLATHLYGPEGPAWGTSFASLEELAVQVSRLLGAELIQLAAQRQADQPVPSVLDCCPVCSGSLDLRPAEPRSLHTGPGLCDWQEPARYCPRCRRAFFPQSKSLGLDSTQHSPAVQAKVVYAGVACSSYANAADLLWHLSELAVPTKEVERLTRRIGEERVQQREQQVTAFAALPLVEKFQAPEEVVPPELAVVMVDGGRLQIRERQPQGETPPAEAAGLANREADWQDDDTPRKGFWREDKVGLLIEMNSEPAWADPCPEIPEGFRDVLRIPKLAREIGKVAAAALDGPEPPQDDDKPAVPKTAGVAEYQPPGVETRRVVASCQPWPTFARVVASAAWEAGFQQAKRKAFVADGSANNWRLQRRFFGSFVPVLDFIHALSYVYAAAVAGQPFALGWERYQRWIGLVWQGEVSRVIDELAERQREVGLPRPEDGETSVPAVVAGTLRYLRNQQDKMNYPEYRKEGLPITSSLMESTVKQMNERVKGTEKFWCQEGAEGIVQLRGDHLSDDAPLDEFWRQRQANATGHSYRRAG